MMRIFVFITGHTVMPNPHRSNAFSGDVPMWTSCAITEQGKWMAGSVSQHPDRANQYCKRQAEQKAPQMLSDKDVVIKVTDLATDPEAQVAVMKAFGSMP